MDFYQQLGDETRDAREHLLGAAAIRRAMSGDVTPGLYLAFLGRPNGPRAGWLLASLERDFVIRRLTEAGAAATGEATA